MECKITCDGKECATISRTKDGISVKWTDECKKQCASLCGGDAKGCC
ncbi:MAG: hypothetical protein PHG85_03700 [Candidatus Altiarchaeota archaeon]|nr:hypothetical protein [Candidatus Altiarchaeota archaeon]